MNTPSTIEKAKEILDKFKSFTWATHPRAKKCAIICVEQIIESMPTSPANGRDPYEDEKIAAEYWASVKEQILLL